jgi:hypothetical protein
MRIHWARIIVAAVVAEVATIAILVLLVFVSGPSDAVAAEHYAGQLGRWVGPLGGTTLCFLGGLWVARSSSTRLPLQGLLVGVAAAAIDIALLLASGASFQLLFVASNLGRVVAGGLGGWAATRRGSKASLAVQPLATDRPCEERLFER